MPTAAPSRCLVNGCREYAVERGRCATHYKPWERPSAHTRTVDRAQQQRFHDAVIARDPVCTWPGCTAPSTDADHILAVGDGGSRYDPANGQGMCHLHHDVKTRAENADRNRRRAAARRTAP